MYAAAKEQKKDYELTVIVGVPQQGAGNEVGANRASVAKTVGDLGDFAVGVLKVADVIDDGVTSEDGDDPPKENCFQALASLANGTGHSDVKGQLHQSRTLKLLHDTRFLAVVEFLEAPSSTRVVYRDTHGREDDTASPALESGENVKELKNVGVSARWTVAKAWVLEGLA